MKKPDESSLKSSHIVFTDGACKGNPGPGGWGVVILTHGASILEIGGSYPQTTNNEMELCAVVRALEEISHAPGKVYLYTDSQYVTKGVQQWLPGWVRSGWIKKDGEKVNHQALWLQILNLLKERKEEVHFIHVMGHVGIQGNERADVIASDFGKGIAPSLFKGSYREYGEDLLSGLGDSKGQTPKKKKKKSGEAYAYLSLVGGVLKKHSNWKECENRIRGQARAKYKRVDSPQELEQVLKDWGFKKEDISS